MKAFAHFATGVSLEVKGAGEEALAEFALAAQAAPENEDLVLEVARRYLQSKKPEQALDTLRVSAGRRSASGKIHAWLGFAYALLEKKAEATAAFRKAIDRDPTALMAYEGLLQLYLQANEKAKALKLVQRAGKQTSNDPGYWVEVAGLHIRYCEAVPADEERLKPLALGMLARANQPPTQNPLLQERIADHYRSFGEYPKAENILTNLLARFPSALLREKLVDIYARQGKRDLATEQLEAIRLEFPANPQVHFVMGNLAMDSRRFVDAVRHYETAIKLNPDFEQGYFSLVGARAAAGQMAEAEKVRLTARERFKQSFSTELYTALAFTRAKCYAEAAKAFETAESLAQGNDTNRLNHIFYFQMGAAFERAGQYERADTLLAKSIQLSPDFAEAQNYLGYTWADRGVKLHEARKLIQNAVRLEPTNAAYLDSLGWVVFRLGKPKEALNWLLKSVEHSDEPDATILDHLGDVYVALRKVAEAKAAWEKSLSIEDNEAVRRKLEGLASSSR